MVTYRLVIRAAGESIKTDAGADLSGWTDTGYGETAVGSYDDVAEAAEALHRLADYADAKFGAFDGARVRPLAVDWLPRTPGARAQWG